MSHLKEVATLYRQAASLAKKAYNTLVAAPFYDKTSKTTLEQTIENFGSMATSIEKEARKWPHKAIEQKNALKKRFETLMENAKLFEKKGFMRSFYS